MVFLKEEQAYKQQILQILDALCIIHHITEFTAGMPSVLHYMTVYDMKLRYETQWTDCTALAPALHKTSSVFTLWIQFCGKRVIS